MSKSIQVLRERREALAKETRNLLEQNPGATWDASCTASYDEKMASIGQVESEIARHEAVLALSSDRDFAVPSQADRDDSTDERSMLATWARGGEKALSSAQHKQFRNVTSTTVGAEGGFTVQTDVSKALQDALKAYGGVRTVAEILRTEQGNPLNYPTSDGTAEVGELIAENAGATSADPTFGSVSLNVFKFGSKIVAVPIELLQDSAVDIEALISARLTTRIGRVTNQMYTTGTGTGQPRGVVTASTVGVTGATGTTTSVTYASLIALQHSVDPAYRAGGQSSWMFNDSTLRSIRQLVDASGRPIFIPAYEVDRGGGEMDQLLGSRVVINQDVASMAASAKSILFGAFGNYKVRDAMEVNLFRFTDSVFARLGQVGFLAWMRTGGNYVDVGASLKHYVNSAT